MALPAPAPVQRRVSGTEGRPDTEVHAAAAHGTSGAAGRLPFHDQIQAAFGAHDISHIRAHTDGAAAQASRAMGAEAFATGDRVAFGGAPSLHTAAHEAAHVVQQRAGVHLAGGVGAQGDRYEQHADAVADRVVQGRSAEDLLSVFTPPSARGAAPAAGVQRFVLSTGGKRGGGKYYSSLDPERKLFNTPEEAEAHDRELEARKKSGASATPAATTPAATTPAATTGGKAPDRPLSDVHNAEWEAAWLEKQQEVHDAMQAFVPDFARLDASAEVRVRGSLASGIKGNPDKVDSSGRRLLFNPTDFDIDAYVMSNELFRKAVAIPANRDYAARGMIPGSKYGPVNAIIKRMRTALAEITGNRDAPAEGQWKFNVLIRSKGNAGGTVRKDQKAMTNLGMPEEWGNPLVVSPPVDDAAT